MARRSRVIGDFKLRRTLRTIHKTLDNELRPAMQEGADMILEDQRRLIPKDTGAGAAALEAFVAKSGLDAQIGLRGKKKTRRFFYLKFLEHGTKGYSGVLYQRADASKPGGLHTKNRDTAQLSGRRDGLRRRPVKNKSDGEDFFGYYPDIPARPAHPWLRPSYDLNRDEMIALIRAAIGSTLRRAAEGGP
ncbi:HK97-gp10 family putative phage morphogenesis protein [Azotobacter vinelandii]